MNDMQRYDFRALILFITGSGLTVASALWRSFPVFTFIAFTPFLALLDYSWSSRIYYVLLVCLAGILSELILYNLHLNTPVLLYIFLAAGLCSCFRIAQHLTQNRLNKFTLVIVFIAMEFLLLTLNTRTDPVFLADFLRNKPGWTRWNIYTGYLGSSLWILSANLLLYQAIFKSEKVNILLILMSVVIILLPVFYSLQLENDAITKAEMLSLYSGSPAHTGNRYSMRGELISRTGAWVSILIIIFTLVRIKTKKVAR